MGLQPGEQVIIDLLPDALVEELMASAGIELDRHGAAAGLLEEPGRLFDAPALVSHRIVCPRKEGHRRGGVHVGELGRVANAPEAAQHVVEHPHCGDKAAQGVGHIGVHRLRVGADPVGAGAVGPELAVIGPQGESGDQPADVPGPLEPAQDAADRLAEDQQGRGGLPGTQQEAAIHRTGIGDEVGPGHKGAHGVPHQEMGQAGELGSGPFPKGADIPDQQVPALPLREKAVLLPVTGGAAMAQMVVSHHGEAVVGQIDGEGVVPADML